jgi:hypothetical protein
LPKRCHLDKDFWIYFQAADSARAHYAKLAQWFTWRQVGKCWQSRQMNHKVHKVVLIAVSLVFKVVINRVIDTMDAVMVKPLGSPTSSLLTSWHGLEWTGSPCEFERLACQQELLGPIYRPQ